jgi:hypothetical protein
MSEPRRPSDPRITAVHEAAHVVVARVVGCRVGAAEIGDPVGDGRLGNVEVWPGTDAGAYVVQLLAGGAAEEIICGVRDPHDSGDLAKARPWLARAGAPLRVFRGRAEELVRLNRGPILCVAAELLARRRLTRADVARLVG